ARSLEQAARELITKEKRMFPCGPITSASDFLTVGAASATFPALTSMTKDQYFLLTSTTAAWAKQGAAPVASAAAGSMYIAPNTPIIICGADGAKLALIQDAAGGKASLTPIRL